MSADIFSVRASSFSELLDCAARWEAKHLLGMGGRSSGAAHLGTSLHAGTAAFDAARAVGSPISADDAGGVFVDTLRHPEQEVDWGDDSINAAESIGLRLNSGYCMQISPRYNYVGVEVQLNPLEVNVDGVIIRLTGKMDRARLRKESTNSDLAEVITGPSRGGIVDVKSGKRAVRPDGTAEVKGHKAQLGVYELLAENTGYTINEPAKIIGLQTTKDARIGVANVSSAREFLTGTKDQPGALEVAAGILKAGIFPGNSRSALCSEKYCPRFATCRWRD